MHSFVNELLSFGMFHFLILQVYWVLVFAWLKSGLGMAMETQDTKHSRNNGRQFSAQVRASLDLL